MAVAQLTYRQPLFFGQPGKRMFGVVHRPADDVEPKNAAWVFCSPFAEERDNAGRFVLEWANALSALGFWVIRFDHRGNGNSEGLFEDFDADDYLDDIAVAIQTIEEQSGVPCCGLAGLRFGAALAVKAAERDGRDLLLALFEPSVSGQKFADELLRVVMATHLSSGSGETPLTRDQLKEQLAEGALIAVRGHQINQRIFQSLVATDMLESTPANVSGVLIMPIAKTSRDKPRPPIEALRGAFAKAGANVTVELARTPPPWVLSNTEYDVRPAAMFDPSLKWLQEQFPPWDQKHPGREPRPRQAAAPEDGKDSERIVEFDVDGTRVWGVLNIPANHSTGKPVIVMAIMSAHFQVYMARQLAQAGWPSLRFNTRGKGESEGHLEFSTVADMHVATQNGLSQPDVNAAIDYLQAEYGFNTAIVLGICGDAINAVFQAARDTRVVGIAPLELPLLYTPRPKTTRELRDRFLALLGSKRQVVVDVVRPWVRGAARLYRKVRFAAATKSSSTHASTMDQFKKELGELANVNLLAHLLQCLERQVPMLFVFGARRADGTSGLTRIMPQLRDISEAGVERVQYHVVPEADHHFSVPEHTEEVFRITLEWLHDPGQPWQAEQETDRR